MEGIAEFPKEIMIELTNRCNNHCFFCSSSVSPRKKGTIDSALAFRLIEEAYELGCREISLHGMGEALLCERFRDYTEAISKAGYEYHYLTTNGVLAVSEVIDPILDAGLNSIKFSVHAAGPETYRRITGVDAFEKVYQNIRHVSDYVRIHQLPCRVIAYFALSSANVGEEEQFRQMMEPYAEVWITPIHNGSGAKPENAKFAVEGNPVAAIKKLPCPELYQRIVINWEGNAIACSTDWLGELVYGNVREERLDDLWNNETMRRLRIMHESRETLPKICRECTTVAG